MLFASLFLAWTATSQDSLKITSGEIELDPGKTLTVAAKYTDSAGVVQDVKINWHAEPGYPSYEGDDEAYLEEYPEAENTWYWPSRNIQLTMKWNDAWLSNKDCDKDGNLDRHYGHESYIGSGAWITNHMRGGKGKDKWTYFTKIVAVPEDAEKEDGVWYTVDGEEIGPSIWGQFANIQTVESGEGATYVSPEGPGFGKY